MKAIHGESLAWIRHRYTADVGWRFRRSLRILPGVRLNISKRGISSLSVGRRGLTLNVGRKGTKETIGLPGSGISYTTPVSPYPRSADGHGAGRTTAGWVLMLVVAALLAVAGAIIVAAIWRN